MKPVELIREKIVQAQSLLQEEDIDCWLTFVRESSMLRDPMLAFLVPCEVTWHSAFLLTRNGRSIALVGRLDRPAVEEAGLYREIFDYVEGYRDILARVLRELDPRQIALNFSPASEIADGLSHGMYLTLFGLLKEIGYHERIISAEKIISRLRARKSPSELAAIRDAVRQAQQIFDLVADKARSGLREKDVAAMMLAETDRRGLITAWDRNQCPSVFAGPEGAEAHFHPTGRLLEPGQVLNIDFGVRVDGYCSDLQRTFYLLGPGETTAPQDVLHGFNTIVEAIERARRAMRPGVLGMEIDRIARSYILTEGFGEFPHALGHQVGQFAHDGTALLGPSWEKYGSKPFQPLEEGMVFTLEPRLKIPGRGTVTIEEMVVIGKDGTVFLSDPQRTLHLLG